MKLDEINLTEARRARIDPQLYDMSIEQLRLNWIKAKYRSDFCSGRIKEMLNDSLRGITWDELNGPIIPQGVDKKSGKELEGVVNLNGKDVFYNPETAEWVEILDNTIAPVLTNLSRKFYKFAKLRDDFYNAYSRKQNRETRRTRKLVFRAGRYRRRTFARRRFR